MTLADDLTPPTEPRRADAAWLSDATPPLVSIVLTTCDRPEVAARALRSALLQSHPGVEVIVVDDGDRRPFQPPADDRVTVLRTSGREGANPSRNRGLVAARGDWVTFLDDDDELRPHMVAASLDAARASSLPPPVAVVSGIEEDLDGTIERTRVPAGSPRGGTYRLEEGDVGRRAGLAAFNTLMAPIEVMRAIGGFDEDIRAAMHTDLFLRVNAVCSIQALDEITYLMHHHGGARLSTANLARAEGMLRTWEKHREVYAAHPRREAVHLANIGSHYLRAGEWTSSVRLSARALRTDPRCVRAHRGMLLALAGPRAYIGLERLRGRLQGTGPVGQEARRRGRVGRGTNNSEEP